MTSLAPDNLSDTSVTIAPANLSQPASTNENESDLVNQGVSSEAVPTVHDSAQGLELSVDQLASQLAATSITIPPATPPPPTAAELREIIIRTQAAVLGGITGRGEWGSADDALKIRAMCDAVFNHPLERPEPTSKHCGKDNYDRFWIVKARLDFPDVRFISVKHIVSCLTGIRVG